MKSQELSRIPGVSLFTPEAHEDHRGFFRELFRGDGFEHEFVQMNHSRSRAGVLRGLHYHRKQADVWYVARGKAQAMLVDIRKHRAIPEVLPVDLVDESPALLYIPPGVAHGFLAETDIDLIYWVTHYYDGTDEHGIAWNDPQLAAPWRNDHPILSERDQQNQVLDWEAVNLSL